MDAPISPPPAGVSLKKFLLTAVLWLPLAFFLWYVLRTLVIFLPVRGVGWALTHFLPDIVASFKQEYAQAVLLTRFPAEGVAAGDGQQAVLSTDFDPLLYCYGWPVLVALIMATPLSWARTFFQLAVGFLVLVPVQMVGIAGEVLLQLSYNFGDPVRAAVEAHGLSQYLIAFWYQFGYLILPAITPVVAWILMNRAYIQELAQSVPAAAANAEER